MKQILDFGFLIFDSVNPKSKIQNPKCEVHAVLLLTIILSILFFPVAAIACPACKEALFDPGQLHQKLSTAKGYALSIMLMLSVPVILIGGIATSIIRTQRRKSHQIDTPPLSR